jgi:hypothetical protein
VVRKCKTPCKSELLGRLAQLGEHQLDKLGVTGSSPVPPIKKPAGNSGFLRSICLLPGGRSGSAGRNMEKCGPRAFYGSDMEQDVKGLRTPGPSSLDALEVSVFEPGGIHQPVANSAIDTNVREPEADLNGDLGVSHHSDRNKNCRKRVGVGDVVDRCANGQPSRVPHHGKVGGQDEFHEEPPRVIGIEVETDCSSGDRETFNVEGNARGSVYHPASPSSTSGSNAPPGLCEATGRVRAVGPGWRGFGLGSRPRGLWQSSRRFEEPRLVEPARTSVTSTRSALGRLPGEPDAVFKVASDPRLRSYSTVPGPADTEVLEVDREWCA